MQTQTPGLQASAPAGGWASFVAASERLPEVCVPVIGFSDRWVHDDYNPRGFRECFRTDEGHWISAAWNNTHDCYDTEQDEGPTLWTPYPEASPC